MALAIEVMVSMVSGWWMTKEAGSLNVMMIGAVDGSESDGLMMLTMSPVRSGTVATAAY